MIFSFPCLRQIPSSPRQQILVYSLFLKGQISLFIRFIIDTAGRVVIFCLAASASFILLYLSF
ncbi:hypothetical protein LB080_08065 [Lactobacillus delbrueckii subsp. bulgaricus]|nr:hypothetical protein LB080_08065 [Lactobacillus delbrueckii subsp. bulgaricus]